MPDQIFIKTAEAAKRIGLAPSTLETMRCRGDGPPYLRVSRRCIMYSISTLDDWARGREFRSTSEYQT